jgi:SAM-dependent methyltransferase
MSEAKLMSERQAMAANEYDEYIRTEWDSFASDSARAANTLAEVSDINIARVLDVGCGAGQELLPFVRDCSALGVGIDVAEAVGHVGAPLFAAKLPEARIVFMRAAAENLPFDDGAFDVVICRLALPYTHNAKALAEMSRALRPGGVLLLKIHHLRFYMNKFALGLRDGDVLSMIHATRVMLAGLLYHGLGRQIRVRLISAETFLSERLLRRELKKIGLVIRRETSDSNPLTPSFNIIKGAVAD